jgi:hypothetical protein
LVVPSARFPSIRHLPSLMRARERERARA